MSIRWRDGCDIVGFVSGFVDGDVDGEIGKDVVQTTGCVPLILLLLPPSERDVVAINLFIA